MPLQPPTKQILSRFVEKADKLRRSTFLKEINSGGWKMDLTQYPVKVTRPHDEALEAFVLTLRFFMMANEATSFQSLEKLVDDPSMSPAWKESYSLIRSAVNDMLATAYGEYRYGGTVHRFTNRDIVNTFLNGGLVHANDPNAVARLKEWQTHPGIVALLEMWFVSTLRSMCQAILLLSDACEHQLAQDSDGAAEPPAG